MNLLRKTIFPLLLAGAMFTQSCKSDSTGPDNGGNNNATAVAAKKGSSYYYHLHHKNSAGATVKSDTNIYSITEDQITILGRSNVRQLHLTTEGEDQGTIAYLSYNSDNSASIFFPISALLGGLSANPWIRLPLSSAGNSQVTVSDTTIDFFGELTRWKTDVNSVFLSSENLSVAGKSYAAKKFKLTMTSAITAQGQTTTDVSDTFMWWIPEIGFLGKTEETLMDDNDQEVLSTETLVRFILVK